MNNADYKKIDTEFNDIALKEIAARPGSRIFSFDYKGQKVWIKQAEKVQNVTWVRFARWACLTLGMGIFQPGADPDGEKAIRLEAGRLRRLKRLGISVPHVFGYGKNWTGMSDGGRNARDVITDKNIPEEKRLSILADLARELAKLNKLGYHHGRPALKDMMYDGNKVTILDFEDGMLIGLKRERKIQRDILLFVQSIMKETEEQGWKYANHALKAYGEINPQGLKSAADYFGSFDFLHGFFKLILRRFGSDLESTYQTLNIFREYKNK